MLLPDADHRCDLLEMRTEEQVVHDEINLQRLMKRLELVVQDGDWSKNIPPKRERETWIKAQAMLQRIRHAQLLLKNVELDNVDPTPAEQRRYRHFETTLRHLEDYMHQVEQQSTPPVRRPEPLLPYIRPPLPKSPVRSKSIEPASPQPVEATLIPAGDEPSPTLPGLQDLLPASPDLPPPPSSSSSSSSLLPDPDPDPDPEPGPSNTSPPAPPSSSKIIATPTIVLQNSRALQEQLSEQLAAMATQLRRNATHFSQSLERDKSVIEVMQEKVEGNFEFMKRERVRLRDFRGKSGSTTCLVMMSVVVVLIAFVLMVFVIRLT